MQVEIWLFLLISLIIIIITEVDATRLYARTHVVRTRCNPRVTVVHVSLSGERLAEKRVPAIMENAFFARSNGFRARTRRLLRVILASSRVRDVVAGTAISSRAMIASKSIVFRFNVHTP